MTFKAAKTALKAINMKLEKTDFGEYRVNFFCDDREATAYYTDDIMDAYQTGVQMRAMAARNRA
jgi:hypothetical protein